MSGPQPPEPAPASRFGAPTPRRPLAALFFVLVLIVILIEFDAIQYAYEKIGIGHRYAFALLFGSLLGSRVNLPLKRIRGAKLSDADDVVVFGMRYRIPPAVRPAETIVALNLGGAVIPTAVSVYICAHTGVWIPAGLATMIIAVIVHQLARPVRGLGIAMPPLLPPILTALVALLIARDAAPAVAYVAGSVGTLVGADLTNLHRIPALGAPVASIGGAGTFDGIFLTGVIAVLLA